jgi:hypothetical protein
MVKNAKKKGTFKKRRRNQMRYSHKMQRQRGGLTSTAEIVKELTTTNPELPRIIQLSEIMREKMMKARIDIKQAPDEKSWYNFKKTKDDIIKKNKEYNDAYYLVAFKLNQAYMPLLDMNDPNIENEIIKNLNAFYRAFGLNLDEEINLLDSQIKKNIELLELYRVKNSGTNLNTYIKRPDKNYLMKHENKIKTIQNETNTQQKINELNSANAELTKNMENLKNISDSLKAVYENTGSVPNADPSLNTMADLGSVSGVDTSLVTDSDPNANGKSLKVSNELDDNGIEMTELNSNNVNKLDIPTSLDNQTIGNEDVFKAISDNDLGGGQRGGGIEELKEALTNLNTNLEASIPSNLLRQTQTQIPVLKSNELLSREATRNSAENSNSVAPSAPIDTGTFRQSDVDLATANSLRDHFSTLTEGQTLALQKELSDIKQLLQGRVASAAASNTGMGIGTSGPSTSFDLSEAQLRTVLNDSYMQIIQYLKLVQKIVEKKPNKQLSTKIDAALAALQITEADTELANAGLDVEKIKQISNNKVSGIADILFSLLGMGIITSTALGGRKTRKHGKGKKRRQSLKRVHNKKYRIQLYSKGKGKSKR